MKPTKNNQPKNGQHGESGNALFLILIAVALFAALSYAVTTSGRGSGTVDREQSLISASQITQYPAAIRTAVTRMIITGTASNDVNFLTTNATDVGVFSTSGGGAVVQDPPANIGTATDWRFKAIPVTGVGGFFISGIGNDAGLLGRDSYAFLSGINASVCQNILRGLGLPSATADVAEEATTVNLTSANEGDPLAQAGGTAATGDNAGNNAYSFNMWDTAGSPTGASDPQAFACVDSDATGATNYVYYHALIEQ